ncbi:MAG TPA: LamG domain-containing protein [Thermoanaerobaculia bacterium]|nr:LamG domain-containing protein [Thermoanaerobaculia bacterium]
MKSLVRRVSGQFLGVLLLALAFGFGLSGAAVAQPFGGWLDFNGTNGYISIPHNPALNPTTAFTFEAWVKMVPPTASICSSIAGKGWTQAWWIGICQGSVLRSYVQGNAIPGQANFDAGVISSTLWTHIAVTYDGANRRHYINGQLVGTHPETGPLTSSTAELRIGSDPSYTITPSGSIDEVNLWNVARTQAQIQMDMSSPITGPVQGLLAVWSFNGNANDSVAVYEGTPTGSTVFSAPAPPAGAWLTTAQIPNFQFKVRVTAGTAITGVQESDCTPETLCVSASIPGRSEVLVRIVGPKPNGLLWPNIVKFNTSQVEVWAEQLSTGSIKYYVLPGAWPGLDTLPGLYDRTGFAP